LNGRSSTRQNKENRRRTAAVEAIPFVAEEKEMAPEEIALAALRPT